MSDTEMKDPAGDGNRPRFGTVAVELGYITPAQLKEALSEQVDDDLANCPHRPIGSILFDRGVMTTHQLEAVLDKTLEAMRTSKKTSCLVGQDPPNRFPALIPRRPHWPPIKEKRLSP